MSISDFSTGMLIAAAFFLCAALLMLVPTGIIRMMRIYKTRHDESYKPDLKTKFDVDIIWYFGIVALMLGVGWAVFGCIFAALFG